MKQFVLVAGVDFEFQGVDFRSLCDNRRKRIVAANTAKVELRFTTMDFRSGEVVRTDVAYPSGAKVETSKTIAKFDPVGKSSYETVTFPDGSRHTRFKSGQFKVLSITDVYAAVRAIGSGPDPGSLAELHFFSHGWMGGPILVDSDDDRTALVPTPGPGGAVSFTRLMLTGMTMRDPDDKDPRAQFDFVAPTMDKPALAEFRKAFAKDGLVWLWGCSFPLVVHHILTAIERSSAYQSSGLGDDVELTLTGLNNEDVDFLERFLKAHIGPFPKPRTTVKVPFKWLKFWACQANQSAFAAQIAAATGVETRAAPLGTYADYDTGKLPLMHVFPSFTAHFTFYKNYLGMDFDPESRHYGITRPGTTCPVP
ncbi:hypothetical protein ACPA54_00460 [Uniformispora flossi]|uniref:hypothetical protein n=1 Tax=Uniformispora flossi TaxID=3390723 RepID=UPI003C2B90D9